MGAFVIDAYRRASLIRRAVAIKAQPLNEGADYVHRQRFLHEGPSCGGRPRRTTCVWLKSSPLRRKPSAAPCARTGLTTGRLNCLRQQRSF
jgi:hypothetical protein